MDSFRFSDHQGSEPEVALGLTAPRLGLAGMGAAIAWAFTEVPGPAPIRLGAAGLVAVTTAMLAWGRVQGVSLARWSWLAVRYLGRSLEASGDRVHLIDSDRGVRADPETGIIDPGAFAVAFVSLRPGTGCSSVCRAVGAELKSAAENVDRSPGAGPVPTLILYDWGSRPGEGSKSHRVVALVVVWDGIELYPGQLAVKLGALRGTYPLAFLLAALNRAGPASHLASRIAEAGARLVCSIPSDPSWGTHAPDPIEAFAPPSAEGVRALANAVLAASRS